MQYNGLGRLYTTGRNRNILNICIRKSILLCIIFNWHAYCLIGKKPKQYGSGSPYCFFKNGLKWFFSPILISYSKVKTSSLSLPSIQRRGKKKKNFIPNFLFFWPLWRGYKPKDYGVEESYQCRNHWRHGINSENSFNPWFVLDHQGTEGAQKREKGTA